MKFMQHLLPATIIGFAVTSQLSTTASAHDRHIRIINESSQDMIGLYASNVGRQSWEEDILGNRILPSGTSTIVNLNDNSGYCRFDLKAVFEDGAEAERDNVDICTLVNWRIGD